MMPAKDGSKPKRRLRPKIGDLLEFQTAKGLGYAQYTHRFDDKFYRDLIRVIEGLFDERPADLEALAARPTLFWVYFPVASEAWRGTLTLLGPVAIPPEAREKPAMRSTLGVGHAPPPETWRIVDATGRHRITAFPPGFWQLSDERLTFGPSLIEDIEMQVRPEDRPLRELAERAKSGSTT